jgi:hypothetical protein
MFTHKHTVQTIGTLLCSLTIITFALQLLVAPAALADCVPIQAYDYGCSIGPQCFTVGFCDFNYDNCIYDTCNNSQVGSDCVGDCYQGGEAYCQGYC